MKIVARFRRRVEIAAYVVNVTSIVEGEHDENEIREAFKPSEKVAIGRAVEVEIGKRQGQRTDKELPQNIAEVKGKETRQIAAEKAGFGNSETYRQAKAVVDEGIPELVEKIDGGDVAHPSQLSLLAFLLVLSKNGSSQTRSIFLGGFLFTAQDTRGQCR
ncbi:hypothetical protein [Rhizobium gallicum]|uniref:hypothetical protein n=1 Tax=Rhizobium gallicum TaxID=56730 RepID=UPI0012EB6C9C|nr:hypothetical protein [Rhizobium gallicum]